MLLPRRLKSNSPIYQAYCTYCWNQTIHDLIVEHILLEYQRKEEEEEVEDEEEENEEEEEMDSAGEEVEESEGL